MLFAHLKAAYEQLTFDNVVWVEADEMNLRKGHNYLTVLGDLIAKWVLFATLGKGASVWLALAAEMQRRTGHPKAFQHVAVDMIPAYAIGVSDNLGKARVVSDKFYVIQNMVETSDQVGKPENRADAGERDRLERARWMWLENRVNWTKKKARSASRWLWNGA